MPQKFRLSRADFAHTRAFKRYSGTLFSLLAGVIPGRQHGGGACVISTKVAQSAVVRNRVKRRVRDILRPRLLGGGVYIFVAKRKAAEATFQDLETDIVSLLETAMAQMHRAR